MKASDLEFFKHWFSDYCRSFYSSDPEDQKNILLKEHHTRVVCRNIVRIAEGLALNSNEIMLAEAAALFHDIGRFRQYAQFRTFRDDLSLNHGSLGADMLVEENVLKDLPEKEQALLISTVRFHNAFTLQDLQDREEIMFLKLVRDADKLDIWRVFSEYYEQPEQSRSQAVGLGLPDTPEYSAAILACFKKRQTAHLSDLKTLNDLKLMVLLWVYDLNFDVSVRFMLEGDYINKIAAKLPQYADIAEAVSLLLEYARQKAG